MTLPPLDERRAREIIGDFPKRQALVVGDVMLDRFIVGRVTRISPEAPVPVVRFQSEHARLGGAANVAENLTALGARVSLVGMVGADPAASRLRELLTRSGICPDFLVADSNRPTIEKLRIVTERHQQVARIDYEEDGDATGIVEQQIMHAISALLSAVDVVLVSDYLKGTITESVVHLLLEAKRHGTPVVIDPKIPHLAFYRGATLITPNHHEAEIATHCRINSDDDARRAAIKFRAQTDCDAVLITRGEHGMWLVSDAAEGPVPAVAREVADVTGAGDTVVATLGLALSTGATLTEAATLANHAAGVVVGKFGPAAVTAEELLGTV